MGPFFFQDGAGTGRCCRTFLGLFAAFLTSAHARAQTTASPLTRNNFNLEVSQGPITTASRIVGLAGAYTAMAEWCEGEYSNAASPAVRAPYSLSSFDYDVCLGLMAPGAFGGVDFENRGAAYPNDPGGSRFNNSIGTNLGLQLQFGHFGVTVDYDGMTQGVESVSLGTLARTSSYSFRIDRVTASAGWALFDGQFVLGAGTRVLLNGINASSTAVGAGFQVGAIFRPNLAPYRIALAYRDPVRIPNVTGNPEEQRADGTQVANGAVLPATMVVPLELEAGIALDFGPHQLNPEWIDPDRIEEPRRLQVSQARLARTVAAEERIARAPEGQRELLRWRLAAEESSRVEQEELQTARERATTAAALKQRSQFWPRKGITLLASVLVTGSTPNAVSISGFLLQKREPYGGFVTVSPRVGFETEAIPHWVTVRGGTYLEPSRYEGGRARAHLTGGVDIATVRFTAWGLFADNPWRLRLALDVAPRYSNFAIAIGQYH
jgi:hypothetical protein